MCPGSFITEPAFSCFIENSTYNSAFVLYNGHFISAFYSQQQKSNLTKSNSSYLYIKNRYLITPTNQPSYKPYNHQIL